MLALPITSTIASALAILMFPLTMAVSLQRLALGKAMGDLTGAVFGDADDDTLRRRIRAFGNFIEYAPFCVLMLALFESAGASTLWMWSLGASLILGRVIHAAGMLYARSPVPRAIGMMLTYVAFLGPAVGLVRLTWL
jgi:uncharacterized membrane protein YecN with MAPEG domain